MWNWLKGLLPSNRRQTATRKLVEGLLPTTQEVRDTKLGIDEGAFTLASPEPPYNQGDHVGYRIAAKRDELGFKDDDGLVFTVPIVESHCCGKVTRLVTDVKNAKFKRIR